MTPRTVEIISTAHWAGDPRLNRHIEYLSRAGHQASLITFAGTGRMAAMARALTAVIRSPAELVLLPDPEMFLPGSLLARLRGKKPLIDIHEDYAKAAMARPWVPAWARGVVRWTAATLVWAGRLVSWRVMVAAPELARAGDFVALNIPDPDSLEMMAHDGSARLVYVGDITVARGALAMIEALSHLDEGFELVMIGGASDAVLREIDGVARQAGVVDRLRLTGRLEPGEAWSEARGALAGLNFLTPAPAYRDAIATKLWEYMAVGLPPIVSDLPGQAALVSRIDEELICGSPMEVAVVATALSQDTSRRASLARIGRQMVEEAWSDSRPDQVIQAAVEP